MATGSKTGGRKRGTPNQAIAAKAAAIAASGLTPLDFAIATMRRYAAKAETWELIADDETVANADNSVTDGEQRHSPDSPNRGHATFMA